jgi:hypothetical protein|tara:strand:- start:169 stop:2187 length:2019 start_codon:yes stop_codon:yes gene_type:complete
MPDLNNYKNMSMEDLGKSLLSQQASSRAKSRRRSRKKEKISKAMAILLGGQAMFNKAIADRSKELDSFNTIMARKNKKFVAEMKIIGNVLDSLPVNVIDSKDAYQQYLKSPSLQRSFRAQVRPIIANAMQKFDKVGYDQAVNAGTITADLNKIIDGITAPYFLQSVDGGPSRAQQVLDSGEKYFKGTDRDEIADRLFGITESDVEANQALRLKSAKEKYRKGTNWFNVPGMLGKFFKGEPTNFRALETGDYTQSDLMNVFEKSINFGEFITPNFSEVMKAWDNNRNYISQAMGIEALMDTSPNGRQAKAMDMVIRQAKIDLNEAPPEHWTKADFNSFRIQKLKLLEEADLMRRAIYSATPTELDAFFATEVASTWGGLRLLLDNPDREAAITLESKYKVDLSKMNIKEKDAFAMRIILAEGVDPIDPTDYGGRAFKKDTPNYDSTIPGTLEIYEKGDREFEFGREGAYDESNFKNNLNKIKAYLTPTFKGINSSGVPEVSDSIKELQSNEDTDAVGGNNIANTINSIAQQNNNAGESFFTTMMANNPTFANQVNTAYPDKIVLQEAINNGTFSLQPPPTFDPVDQQMVEIKDEEAWRSPYTAEQDLYDSGETGIQIFSRGLKEGWNNQLDREAVTTIERHLTGRVKNRSGYQKALKRLGISDEEARLQYSVQ